MSWTRTLVGGGLALFGAAMVFHGIRRFRRSGNASAEPLDFWEHYMNFGLLPREFGSRRRVERFAAIGEVAGGFFAVLAGLTIFAVGLGD